MVDETIVDKDSGIHKPICTVNKSDNLHHQLYIALRPMRLPVHNKLRLEAWALLPRWNALQRGEMKNGADDETILPHPRCN